MGRIDDKKKIAIAAIFVVWIFFVLTSFFTVQKPFAGRTALALANRGADLLVALWLLLVALGVGRWLLVGLRLHRQPLLAQLIFAPPLGLGAVGLLSLAVGLAGGFHRWVAYGVTAALTLVALPQWRALWRRRLDSSPTVPNLRPGRLTVLFLGAMIVLTLLLALLPPTDWDGLFYHLTAPDLYIEVGRISSGYDVPHFSFPALMEMLFAWAMLLRGDVAAKLLHTSFAFFLAGLVYLIAVRWFSARAGWRAVVLLAAMPMIGTLAGWAYNDLALAFVQLAAIYWLAVYLLPPTAKTEGDNAGPAGRDIVDPRLILSGIFAGLAMSFKYTSFATPLFVVAAVALFSLREMFSRGAAPAGARSTRQQLLRTAAAVAAFSAPALLVAAPWYLKNWAFTGNPVYPFLYDLFGGHYWDAFRAAWYSEAGTGIGWQLDLLIALPWLLTLGYRDANFWDGRTGPLLLLFLPLVLWQSILLLRRPAPGPDGEQNGAALRRVFGVFLLFVLVQYLVWTLGVIWSRGLWQSRLLLPGLVAFIPLAAWGWVRLSDLDTGRFSLSGFVNLVVVVTLGLTLLDVSLVVLRAEPLPPLLGLESRGEYLERRLGAHYGAMDAINQRLPEEAVVAFLWEPRSYYCERACRPDSILDAFPHLVHQHGTADAIVRQWREEGVTHVLIHRAGLNFLLDSSTATIDRPVLTELEATYLREVADVGGAYQIYALSGP